MALCKGVIKRTIQKSITELCDPVRLRRFDKFKVIFMNIMALGSLINLLFCFVGITQSGDSVDIAFAGPFQNWKAK